MEIILKRIGYFSTFTTGILIVKGQYFCDTLEPTDRALEWDGRKLKGRTAIPLGRYVVTLTHSPRFGRTLPLVNGVPDFSAIRIHSGNAVTDTQGCILVGVAVEHPGTLIHSVSTLNRLVTALAKEKQNTLTVTR